MTLYDSIGNSDLGFAAFIRIDGFPKLPQTKYRDITRPGMDGVAFQQLGARGEEFTLRTIVDVTGTANFLATSNGYIAMKQAGELVNISLANNAVEYDGYLILDVVIEKPVPCIGVGGINSGNVLLIANWTMIYADTQ
jgi:hypothetical protein